MSQKGFDPVHYSGYFVLFLNLINQIIWLQFEVAIPYNIISQKYVAHQVDSLETWPRRDHSTSHPRICVVRVPGENTTHILPSISVLPCPGCRCG